MRLILRFFGWLLKTALFLLLAAVVGLLEGITILFRFLRDKCQPR